MRENSVELNHSMTLISTHPHPRSNYINGKRFFVTVLFLNLILGCVYYVREQEKQVPTETTIHLVKEDYSSAQLRSKTTNQAIEYIRKTLDNEYDHRDLMKFYNQVHKEYSLGLKCTRPEVRSKSNSTSSSRGKTALSSSHVKSRSSSKHSNFRRYHRTDLYTFTIDNAQVCSNETVDLVIIIISKSANYQTRDAIRRTWASGQNLGLYDSINVKYLFLIDYNDELSHNIRLENDLFHDIIQVELPQQYTLVTHRVLSLFEWSFRFCRSAKYLFKTDDDIFINLILVLKFLRPLLAQPIDSSFSPTAMNIYGYRHVNPIVFRDGMNSTVFARYIITFDEYPCSHYPMFLSGFGYLISRKARDAILYTAYQDPKPFRISDAYVTGIIPEYLSMPRHSLSNYRIYESGDCESVFANSTAFACAAGAHVGSAGDVFENYNRYWQLIKETHGLIHE